MWYGGNFFDQTTNFGRIKQVNLTEKDLPIIKLK